MIIQCAPINVIFVLIACGSMGLGTMSELPPAPNEHIPYVRKFSRLIILVVFVVRKDPRNYSSANINEKMAADGIMYRFCL